MTINQLVDQLAGVGGAIVSSKECSEMEIAIAQSEGRFAVDDDGLGFLRRPKEWVRRSIVTGTVSACADRLEKWMSDNCGSTADWPAALSADNDESAKTVADLLSRLKGALVEYRFQTDKRHSPAEESTQNPIL